MKLFSIIVLAALCATAVKAAPPTTPNFSFEQYLLSTALNKITKKTQEFFGKIECIHDAIGKVFLDSDVKDVWDESKGKLEDLVHVEWKKCKEMNDTAAQAKCKAVVVQQGVAAVTEFIKILITEAKWSSVKQVKDEIVSQCFAKDVTVLEATLPQQFECFVDVVGNVSRSNGLTQLWAKSEPQLRDRLNKWKQCPNAGNKFRKIICNLWEGISSFRIFNEYIKLVAETKPEVVEIFAREIQQNCNSQNTEVLPDFMTKKVSDVIDLIERVKCISGAISDAVAETEFKQMWEEYKEDVTKLVDNIKACKAESNGKGIWQNIKCVVKEAQAFQTLLEKFYNKLNEASVETYEKVQTYVKERCYA